VRQTSQLLNGLFRNLSPTTDPLAALVGCFGRCVHYLSGWEKCVCVWSNTWVVSKSVWGEITLLLLHVSDSYKSPGDTHMMPHPPISYCVS